MMDSDSVIWPDDTAPEGVQTWVSEFFATADTEGEDSARRFAEFFQDDAIMIGMTDPIHGKQGLTSHSTRSTASLVVLTDSSAELIAIYEARLKAWDTVKTRKHTLFKVYTIKKDFSDILILGKLDSTMKNERSFEMEFVAQVLFAHPQSEKPVALNYKVWAVRNWLIRCFK